MAGSPVSSCLLVAMMASFMVHLGAAGLMASALLSGHLGTRPRIGAAVREGIKRVGAGCWCLNVRRPGIEQALCGLATRGVEAPSLGRRAMPKCRRAGRPQV